VSVDPAAPDSDEPKEIDQIDPDEVALDLRSAIARVRDQATSLGNQLLAQSDDL
jgi:hypothetical protein